LVSPAQAAGKTLRIRIEQRAELEAQVVRPPFYDPRGERQRVSASQATGSPPPEPAAEREHVSAPAVCRARLPLESWFRTPRPAGAPPERAVLSLEVHGRRARFGCKGPAGAEWLESCGFRVPTAPNSALLSAGVLVARLATAEFLIEAVSGGSEQITAAERQLTSAAPPKAVYPVTHQDLVLTLQGSALQRLLRQICSYDFAALLENPTDTESPVVLASMIGVGVVAWAHRSAGGAAALTLWLDPSFAHYFWTTLLEVARDLGDVHINESGGAPE
jgi:sarcosine oxidase subunit gamma